MIISQIIWRWKPIKFVEDTKAIGYRVKQIKRIIIDSSIIDFIICRVSEWLSIASGVWFVLNVPANGHRVESRTKNLPELVRDAA